MENSKLPLRVLLISGIGVILLLIAGLVITIILLLNKDRGNDRALELRVPVVQGGTAQKVEPQQKNVVKKIKEQVLPEEKLKWNAKIVSSELPSKMKRGERVIVKITVENTGESSWDTSNGDNFGLRTVDYTYRWRDFEDNLQIENIRTIEVPSGRRYSFALLIRAPDTSGEIPFHWRMYRIRANREWAFFGEELRQNVVVR